MVRSNNEKCSIVPEQSGIRESESTANGFSFFFFFRLEITEMIRIPRVFGPWRVRPFSLAFPRQMASYWLQRHIKYIAAYIIFVDHMTYIQRSSNFLRPRFSSRYRYPAPPPRSIQHVRLILRNHRPTALPPSLHGLLHRPTAQRKHNPQPRHQLKLTNTSDAETEIHERRLSELRTVPQPARKQRQYPRVHVAGLRGVDFPG